MNEAALTADGWYALHDFRTINWAKWKKADDEERAHALEEVQFLWKNWLETEQEKQGSTALYTIIGQKADIIIVHLRETLDELNTLETELNKASFAAFTSPAYSYVSIVELSNYISKSDTPQHTVQNDAMSTRLKPELPKSKHICFYPMNKKRDLTDNWYMLSMEERRQLMHSHSNIGRQYDGKIKQIITGSIGLDDWEWGVTLFSNDPLQFKKLIYEMRFDEVSARFGEFGSFYVGNVLTIDRLHNMMKL